MSGPRLAVIGLGRMGRTISILARERGWPVVAEIEAAANPGGDGITTESLRGAQVAIELTTPRSAAANAIACFRAGCPVVVGTTGWEREREDVEAEAWRLEGALLVAANFSLGVHIFQQISQLAARLAALLPSADVQIVETHHAAKRDAPSGTARDLERNVELELGHPVNVTSMRVGHVPGTHELIIDGAYEQLRVVHQARDRRVFADGALAAAEWLIGRRGVFTMRDVLAAGPGERVP